MKNAWLVFIESNTSGTGRLFIKAAREHGYQPVMLTERPERYAFLEQDSVPYALTARACARGPIRRHLLQF